MTSCTEYAQVSSECPGSSWSEYHSFLDSQTIAPGAICQFEGVANIVDESDTYSVGVLSKIIYESCSTVELKSTPGSLPSGSQIALSLLDAIEWEHKGKVCMALDIVYSRVAEWIRMGWIKELNDEIASIDPNAIGTDVLLGILTSTLPVRSQLPYRRELYRVTPKILKRRRHFEQGILDGLE